MVRSKPFKRNACPLKMTFLFLFHENFFIAFGWWKVWNACKYIFLPYSLKFVENRYRVKSLVIRVVHFLCRAIAPKVGALTSKTFSHRPLARLDSQIFSFIIIIFFCFSFYVRLRAPNVGRRRRYAS